MHIMRKSLILISLILFVLFSGSAFAGLCTVPNTSCNGYPCTVNCTVNYCGTFKSTATAFGGCYPSLKWAADGHYNYSFALFQSNTYDGLKIIANSFDSVGNGYKFANGYVVARLKKPDGSWINICDAVSCIGGSIASGINSTNTFPHTTALNGIPAVFSWANNTTANSTSEISYTLPQDGNYILRVFVLGTAPGNTAKLQIQLYNSSSGSALSHLFYSSSREAAWSDDHYYQATNALCSDQIRWSNASGTSCQDVDTLAEFDYMEYSWCKRGTEVCNGIDDNCDGNIDEGGVCPRCVGAIDGNASLISPDENIGLSVTVQNTLVDVNTSAKCEWKCNAGFVRGGGTDANKCIKIGSEMVFIPSGTFKMGNGYQPEKQQVTLTESFCMDKYEVTKSKWDEIKTWGENNGYIIGNVGGKNSNHPAHSMNWYQALKWSNARSERERLEPAYYTDSSLTTVYKSGTLVPYVDWDANGYRLPTEAEWEYSAKGGTTGYQFPWNDGGNISHSRANYYSCGSQTCWEDDPTEGYHPVYVETSTPYTSPVGSFSPNPFGLFDMAGNVFEWNWNWYTNGCSPSNCAAVTDPHGQTSTAGPVIRGGGWGGLPYAGFIPPCSYSLIVYHRNWSSADGYSNEMGFRNVAGNNSGRCNSFVSLCNGAVDGNAVLFLGDGINLTATDLNTNILVDTNTSRKCEWKCKSGFVRGSGADSNKCFPSGQVIQITNCTQLQQIQNNPNLDYALSNDINCVGTKTWNFGKGFLPISPFTGNLNGNGYKIFGLTINSTAKNGFGVFGCASGTISNLGMTDVNIIAGRYGGSLAFNANNVINSYSTGKVIGGDGVGGLVGIFSGIMTNSYSTADVFGSYSVGGLTGRTYGALSKSYATGNVTGGTFVGGLSGVVGSSTGSLASISDCYARGNIAGNEQVGGLVGVTYNNISNSYATGNVVGTSSVGGLVGYKWSGFVQNSFWDFNTSNQLTSAGGSGQTTIKMKMKTTFPWDFINTWDVCEAISYPTLRWQGLGGANCPTYTCRGSIDGNAQIYEGDDLDITVYDLNTNVLVDANTSRKCEWYCKEGFVKGSDADENKCLPITYSCLGAMSENSVACPLTQDNLPHDLNWTLIDSESSCTLAPKCSSYCGTNYIKDNNYCIKSVTAPEGEKNSILDFTAESYDGSIVLKTRCLYDAVGSTRTVIDLNLLNENNELIFVQTYCSSDFRTTIIKPTITLQNNQGYTFTASIKQPCLVCQKQAFFYYAQETQAQFIPDSNPFAALLLALTILLFAHKKRI